MDNKTRKECTMLSYEEKEMKYVEYKLKGLLDSKELFKEKHPDYNEHDTLMSAFRNEYDITVEEYDEIVAAHLDIQDIKNKCTQKREEGFGGIIEFYKWYKKQGQKCCYCGTTQDELNTIFNAKVITSKKFTATLHIERFNSEDGYKEGNCGLACALCNNAKSDMISKADFENYFSEHMGKYLKAKYEEAKELETVK